jgi:hypothetical protein
MASAASEPAMRAYDALRLVGPIAGAGALMYRDHVALATLLLVFIALLPLVTRDVRDAGGFAAWADEQLRWLRHSHDLAELVRKRRRARRTHRLLAREEHERIRRRISASRPPSRRWRARRSGRVVEQRADAEDARADRRGEVALGLGEHPHRDAVAE